MSDSVTAAEINFDEPTERKFLRRFPRLPVEIPALLIPYADSEECRIPAISSSTSKYGATFVLQHKSDSEFFIVGGELHVETAFNSLRGQLNDLWVDKNSGDVCLSVKLLDDKTWVD